MRPFGVGIWVIFSGITLRPERRSRRRTKETCSIIHRRCVIRPGLARRAENYAATRTPAGSRPSQTPCPLRSPRTRWTQRPSPTSWPGSALSPADRLADLLADFPGGGPAALADHLVAQGELTPFQAGRVKGGEARSLVLGPYLLTRVHGPGVLGLVYRATHRPSRGGGRRAGAPAPEPVAGAAGEAVRPGARGGPAAPGPRPADRRRLRERARTTSCGRSPTGGRWPSGSAPATRCRRRPRPGCWPPSRTGWSRATPGRSSTACVTPQAVGIGPDGSPRLLELGAGVLLAQNLSAASRCSTRSRPGWRSPGCSTTPPRSCSSTRPRRRRRPTSTASGRSGTSP